MLRSSSLTKALAISVLAVILCFGFMDAIWLGLIAADTYQHEMQGMLRVSYPLWPWLTFYLVYAFSITLLAVQPSLRALTQTQNSTKNILIVAARGFVLGLGGSV